ncbi:transposase, partial [Roseinatronobacter sp.]
SAHFAPASCSVRMLMICSSVYLVRFIVRPFLGSDSNSKWRKNPVAGHNAREDALKAWLVEAEESLIAAFARGLRRDQAAIAAALREPWSNGQTEGQINRLKTLKRQMYGRANIDLLRARLVAET